MASVRVVTVPCELAFELAGPFGTRHQKSAAIRGNLSRQDSLYLRPPLEWCNPARGRTDGQKQTLEGVLRPAAEALALGACNALATSPSASSPHFSFSAAVRGWWTDRQWRW